MPNSNKSASKSSPSAKSSNPHRPAVQWGDAVFPNSAILKGSGRERDAILSCFLHCGVLNHKHHRVFHLCSWAQVHGSGISVVLLNVRYFKITMPLNARFHSSTAQLSTNNHQLTTARRASCVKTTLAVFFVCFVCFVVANNSWFLITCVAKCYCLPVALRLSVSQSVTARESQ